MQSGIRNFMRLPSIKKNAMKTKIFTLLIAVCFGFVFPGIVSAAAGDAPSDTYINSNSSKSFLESNAQSSAADYLGSVSTKERGFLRSSDDWSDELDGTITDWSVANNVGAPIDASSLPIALSILLLYIIYRRVSTSRRKSDF